MAPEQETHIFQPAERERLCLVNRARIPVELTAYPQWVCWRFVDRGPDRKPDKQPVNPSTLGNAGVHWVNTWSTFEHAYTTYRNHRERELHGVGFVLTAGDPIVGVDIDDCLDATGFSPLAQEVMDHFQSYTEVSPSGRGLRILIMCPEFADSARMETLEVYSHSRYLTITGHQVEGTPDIVTPVKRDRITALVPQRPMAALSSLAHQDTPSVYNIDCYELWERIFEHDKFGDQHRRRFQGDTALDGADHSLSVIRLLNALARWTKCDTSAMREMMLMSPLANPKWLSKRGTGDWLDHQIADAIRYIDSGK